MTIQTVKAVSYATMKDYLAGNPTNLCATLANWHDKVWIISITSESLEPLVVDGESRLALVFDDVEPKLDQYTGLELERDPDFIYFDDDMAKKVCEFIKKAHESDPDSNDLLLVNCHAGISRSGAVADFARGVVGMDYDQFKRLNPQINPNWLVKGLLRGWWQELFAK